MRRKLLPRIFPFILFLTGSLTVKAQLNVYFKDALEQIKNGYTHIIVDSNYFVSGSKYVDIIKKNWTLTKGIDLVKSEDLDGKMVLGDSYFMFGTEVGTYSNGMSVSDLIFGLWTPTERAVSHQWHFTSNSLKLLVSVVLTQNTHPRKEGPPADGTGPIGSWSPGILKNYMQQVTAALEASKKIRITDDITDKEQIKLLQTQTLYCTPDLFYQYKDDEDKTKYIKETFEDYKYDYRILSPDELSDKILANKEPFYYVIYLHNYIAGKVVAVINSQTGEIIYLRRDVSFAAHIKSRDLKEISNAAQGKFGPPRPPRLF